MIVMDYVDGEVLSADLIGTLSKDACQKIFADVTAAVDLLHKQDIVFADLRRPNILVTKKPYRAKLVDFEWCGRHGVDQYPLSMSHNIPWPDGAAPGTTVMRAHDQHWLAQLKRDLR